MEFTMFGDVISATDKLRSMLDDRGIEWDELKSYDGGKLTRWRDSMGRFVTAYDEGMVPFFDDFYWQPTPEQAINATLGRGTCRRVLYKPTGVLVCSECGRGIPKQLDKYCYLNYCPSCGRRIVFE